MNNDRVNVIDRLLPETYTESQCPQSKNSDFHWLQNPRWQLEALEQEVHKRITSVYADKVLNSTVVSSCISET